MMSQMILSYVVNLWSGFPGFSALVPWRAGWQRGILGAVCCAVIGLMPATAFAMTLEEAKSQVDDEIQYLHREIQRLDQKYTGMGAVVTIGVELQKFGIQQPHLAQPVAGKLEENWVALRDGLYTKQLKELGETATWLSSQRKLKPLDETYLTHSLVYWHNVEMRGYNLLNEKTRRSAEYVSFLHQLNQGIQTDSEGLPLNRKLTFHETVFKVLDEKLKEYAEMPVGSSLDEKKRVKLKSAYFNPHYDLLPPEKDTKQQQERKLKHELQQAQQELEHSQAALAQAQQVFQEQEADLFGVSQVPAEEGQAEDSEAPQSYEAFLASHSKSQPIMTQLQQLRDSKSKTVQQLSDRMARGLQVPPDLLQQIDAFDAQIQEAEAQLESISWSRRERQQLEKLKPPETDPSQDGVSSSLAPYRAYSQAEFNVIKAQQKVDAANHQLEQLNHQLHLLK